LDCAVECPYADHCLGQVTSSFQNEDTS
jgi:hypothetical protein